VLANTVDQHCLRQWQTLLVEAFHHGGYPLAPTTAVATAEYLAVLAHVRRLLLRRYRAPTGRRAFHGPVANPVWEPFWLSAPDRALEMLPMTDRFVLMRLLAWWLDPWPEQFVMRGARAQLTRAELQSGFLDPPAWYEAAVAQVAQSRCAGRKLVSSRAVSAGLAAASAMPPPR
jgi:hypothetical protein